MSSKTVTIGSFEYEDEVYAELVERELEKIEKIEAQIDYANPVMVYTLYVKLLERRMFKTPEGLVYLLRLQAFLDDRQAEIKKEIPPIRVDDFSFLTRDRGVDEMPKVSEKVKEQAKGKDGIYRIIITFLILLIAGMLAISMASGSPTILNYRKQIEDEYASWEKQLTERERELGERERALENK